MSDPRPTYDFVIAANRLPVDRAEGEDGPEWRRSPGGLVTAMDSVMRGRDGAWVGWSGEPGEAPEPFDDGGMHLHPVPLSEQEVADAEEIVRVWDETLREGKGVATVNGRMIENLHVDNARRVLDISEAIKSLQA